MSFAVQLDLKDSTRYMPFLAREGWGCRTVTLTPGRRTLEGDPGGLSQIHGADPRARRRLAGSGRRAVKAIYAFEADLAKASMSPVERRDIDKTYNRRSVAQLAAEAPGFDWAAYFAALG
jgi:hypothetical protein